MKLTYSVYYKASGECDLKAVFTTRIQSTVNSTIPASSTNNQDTDWKIFCEHQLANKETSI